MGILLALSWCRSRANTYKGFAEYSNTHLKEKHCNVEEKKNHTAVVENGKGGPMAVSVVLDSSALLSFLFGEGSAGEVEEILANALEDKREVLVTAVNWAEVLCRVIEARGNEGLSILQHIERTSPIQIIAVDAALAETAGVFSTRYGVPLADAFAAALAKRLNASIVTGDGDFRPLAREVSIQWLRTQPQAAPKPEPLIPAPPVIEPPPVRALVEVTPVAPVVQPVVQEPRREQKQQRNNHRPRRHHRHGMPATQRNGNQQQTTGQQPNPRRNPRHQRGSKPQHRKAHPGQQQRPPALPLVTPRKRVRPDGVGGSDHFQHTKLRDAGTPAPTPIPQPKTPKRRPKPRA